MFLAEGTDYGVEREILILWRVTGDADGLGERDVGGAACRVLWLEPYRAGSDGARCCLSLPELWPSSCFFLSVCHQRVTGMLTFTKPEITL